MALIYSQFLERELHITFDGNEVNDDTEYSEYDRRLAHVNTTDCLLIDASSVDSYIA